MKFVSKHKLLVMFAALAFILSTEPAAAASGSFEQSLSVDGPIVLDVSTGSGAINIRGGSGRDVEVIGHIKASNRGFLGLFRKSNADVQDMIDQLEANPPIELSDGHLRVGHIKDRATRRSVSISYEIVVPTDSEVKSHTGSGSQTIADVAGPVEADTGSGKVTLNNIGGAVSARTGSGSIRADAIAGAFEAHTGSGSVNLTQTAPGDVVVTTGSGSSELHNIDGALRVRAGSGRILVDGKQAGLWRLDTGSGSVHINLPEDAAFELDAESGSGGIVIDHPLTVQGKISKRHMRGEVRGGGELLAIDTGSGGIRVE